jgi:hypothetical protein
MKNNTFKIKRKSLNGDKHRSLGKSSMLNSLPFYSHKKVSPINIKYKIKNRSKGRYKRSKSTSKNKNELLKKFSRPYSNNNNHVFQIRERNSA